MMMFEKLPKGRRDTKTDFSSFPINEPQTYWESVTSNSRMGQYIAHAELRALRRLLGTGEMPGEALDVGCDGGRWACILASRGWNLTCIDTNSDSLEVCRRRLGNARLIQAEPSRSSLPCGSSTMDLIICLEVRNVIESDWFLPEAARVLRPGGRLFATYWNSASPRSFYYRLVRGLKKSDGDSLYYRGMPYSEYRRSILQNRFSLIEETGFCWLPFGRDSNSQMIPLAAKIERLLHLGKLVRFSPWIIFSARKASGNSI